MVASARMSYPGCEQLLSIEQRLQDTALSPQEIDLVRQHRMMALLQHQLDVSVLKGDGSDVEAAREKCKQVEKLKTLRSDILQCISAMLAQQRAGGAAGFNTPRRWQSPGERRRDPASTALLLAPSCRWL